MAVVFELPEENQGLEESGKLADYINECNFSEKLADRFLKMCQQAEDD